MAPQEDVKVDPMEGRVARWSDIRGNGIPVMFIDSVLPGNYRMNYAVIGDTASENPDFEPAIAAPHKFQIGMFEAPPGNGPGWHTHEYVELFFPLTGQWTFSYGNNPDDPDDLLGQLVLDPWDVISFPPGLWRRFENSSDANAVCFAVLDPHEVFVDRDPIWPRWLVEQAAQAGLQADATGRMVVPENMAELEAQITERITGDGRSI
jgi:mannose-6-phosphate isomerase-like protein (cupin superfamily)